MSTTKYGQYIKSLSFKDMGPGLCRQGTEMNGAFLGLDVNIKYGAYWTAGRMGEAPFGSHVHDFNQLMLWMGSDTGDLSELGAEVEICLGAEKEKHVFTSSAAVAVPAGLPHFPATINRMDERFFYMEISVAPECTSTPVISDVKPSEPAAWRSSKYRNRIFPLSFQRKGAWYYGPQNRDDSGGSITSTQGKDLGFNFVLLYESIKKAPYRFNPDPYKPHIHPHRQVMLFLGSDPYNLNELGAEVEIYMGEELERHVFTTPTAVVIPTNLAHWPGGTLKIDKPIIMCDIHPWGV